MAASNSKKRKAAVAQFDRDRQHTLAEAVGVVKAVASAKFDESVDMAVRLGVNPKHADQMVRGALVLPHGTA
jgi:large subunit ribosomal protein L1